ncbi:MAG: hypothetical protein HY674_18725 [Chloroflexi bacterium]|nr:hypothetical protein [Chloroflexota bacterium]
MQPHAVVLGVFRGTTAVLRLFQDTRCGTTAKPCGCSRFHLGAWAGISAEKLAETGCVASPKNDIVTSSNRFREPPNRTHGYAFVYTVTGRIFTVHLGKIIGNTLVAWWFDPRTGVASRIGELSNRGTKRFDPPDDPQDSCKNNFGFWNTRTSPRPSPRRWERENVRPPFDVAGRSGTCDGDAWRFPLPLDGRGTGRGPFC